MRPVVQRLWPDFSPDGGVGAAHALASNTGTDLREVIAAIERWHSGGADAAAGAGIVGGMHVRWWDELMRACAVDGPTQACPPASVRMHETDLDARKVHTNSLHLHLNAAALPVAAEGSGSLMHTLSMDGVSSLCAPFRPSNPTAWARR